MSPITPRTNRPTLGTNRPTLGITLMVLTTMVFAIQDGISRYLAES